MTDNYKGYALFNDVEDVNLRTRNRAVVMANMYEDYPEPNAKGAVSKKGALLIFGYMDAIPANERNATLKEFYQQMEARGYKEAA